MANAVKVSETVFSHLKAAFTWVSKVIRFCFCFASLCLLIGLKISRHFSQPIRNKTKTIRDALVHIFPRFESAAGVGFDILFFVNVQFGFGAFFVIPILIVSMNLSLRLTFFYFSSFKYTDGEDKRF